MINYECCDGLNMGLFFFFFLMNMVVTGFDGKKKKKSKWANLVLCEIFFGGKKICGE